MWDDDFKRRVEVHFAEQRLFSILMIRGMHHMKEALDRLTASTNALIDQSAATDTELGAVVDELKTLSGNMQNSDDSAALNALADKLDASRGNSKTAADAAADALTALHGANTLTAPTGDDTITGGSGDDSLNGGNADDAVTVPVAVVSTDPAHTDGTGSDTVIVTDHPTDAGSVIVTPVTSDGEVLAGSISVDPATGNVTASDDSGVTLGDPVTVPNADSTAADLAAANPDSVVSATPAADVQDA